ncbi:hypothetical protein [Lichenifustis flavocetrariae]|uniref:Localization factor PodJL n=1 Tax=Lichenifustis flavocetrariae TaxID=2949735 RepID=A0AA41YU78_9HYPH|nr:hypothetical protein [Lichenifustis flavocetrariae]MCW6508244.1 hypothetical protein [Lichenifustis flavocetrariae]
MNKPVPWNVKGVGFDAREAARIAAKRAGLSVGDWLNNVISARAAELGVNTDEVNQRDRLEAIATRLTRLDEQHGDEPASLDATDDGHQGETQMRASGAALVDATADVSGGAGLLTERATTLPPRASSAAPSRGRRDGMRASGPSSTASWTARSGLASQLKGIAGGRLGEQSFGLAPTLDTDMEMGETGTNGSSRAYMQPENGELAQAHEPLGSRKNVRAAARTPDMDVERLDARLTSILKKLNRSFEDADLFGEAVADRSDEAPASIKNASLQPLASNGGRRDEVGTRMVEPARVARREREAQPLARRAEKAGGPAPFADLHADFKSLAERLDAQTMSSPRGGPLSSEAGTPDSPRQPGSTQPVSRPGDRSTDRSIDALRREVALLSESLSQLAPQQSVTSLETAVRELIGRVDLSKLDGVQASVLAPVERLSLEMREAIRAADPSKAMESVRRDMRGLADKVQSLQQASDHKAVAEIRNEIRAMHEVIDTFSGRLQTSERLHDEILALGNQVSDLAQRTSPAVSRDLGNAIGDIRGLLKDLGSNGILGTIDRRIEALSARIDKIAEANQQPQTLFEDLTRQIDQAHETLAARLSARVSPPVSLAGLEERIGTLSAKIDTFSRASQDVNALYGLVGGLADRIDDARNPQADAEAMNALQAQIGQLMERLDRSDTGSAALAGIERLIGDLFLQIEQSRNVAIDAAENAARTAAQDTLRAALDNPKLNGGELTVQTGLDVDHVSQGLAELRRIQEASERRVNTTLTALNTTLERLVDRLVTERTAPEARMSIADADTAPKPARRRNRSPSETVLPERQDARHKFDPEQFLIEPDVALGMLSAASGHDGAAPPFAPTPDIGPNARSSSASSVAPLIAAARRAAQAAQASAMEASLTAGAAKSDPVSTDTEQKAHSFFARKRRPLLLGLAGLVLLLGTLQIVRLSTTGDRTVDLPPRKVTGDAAPIGGEQASQDADARARKGSEAPADPTPSTHVDPAPKAPPSGTSLLTPPEQRDVVASRFMGGAAIPTDPQASASPQVAAPPDTGMSGISPGLRDLASSGNAAAQFEVAVRLSEGRGVTRDAKQAAAWFQRAAQQGLASAQYRLGSIYEKGVGVAADPALAVAWYQKAAGQGNVRAMHNLAVMSAEGAGSKPDYGKAVTWFTKAASYGVRDSQFNLAVLFARGLGVPQNLEQSYAWFALAADQGDADAVAKRDTIAAKLDAKGLANAKASVASFHALVPDAAANDVPVPPGGWDAVAPAKTANRKGEARISSM